MKAEVLHDVLESSIQGKQEERGYLGMSQIGRCARRLYFDLVEGREPLGPDARRRCHEGLVHQADLIARIEAEGVRVINRGREVAADFDGRFGRRFLGHIDGEVDGDLLEIKSLEDEDALEDVREHGVRWRDQAQVQAYMHYGGYCRALVVYKVRGTGSVWVCWLKRNDEEGERLERKAERVLAAIDEGTPPECECGRCRR